MGLRVGVDSGMWWGCVGLRGVAWGCVGLRGVVWGCVGLGESLQGADVSECNVFVSVCP